MDDSCRNEVGEEEEKDGQRTAGPKKKMSRQLI